MVVADLRKSPLASLSGHIDMLSEEGQMTGTDRRADLARNFTHAVTIVTGLAQTSSGTRRPARTTTWPPSSTI
jgi:hypothetical protein